MPKNQTTEGKRARALQRASGLTYARALAEIRKRETEPCPGFKGSGDLCSACGEACHWHRTPEPAA